VLGSLQRFRRRVGAFIGGFEAGLANRRLKGFQPSRAHLNTLIASAGPDITARARWLVRNKAGASLTPAGEQLLRYAPTFVQLWQRARHQVAVPPGHRAVLTVGSEVSLWQPLLVDWVIWMRRSLPDIALRVHVDVPQDLTNHVASGFVDIAVMYAPQHRPGLKVDLLMEEELVLATTDSKPSRSKPSRSKPPSYVHVDWGPDFALRHDATFPEAAPSLVEVVWPLYSGAWHQQRLARVSFLPA
jgi:DNA-binding transcriptional LysR family regulator